mmetsp:Transcript_15186/g.31574  ORF Transcript_15186/g.31574 Transcript_15186/m.31574 type:complete len:164 (+) Transcript_15186:429-920(+)
MRPWIAILLRQTKINDVDDTLAFAQPYEEVIRLHVTMDETFCVHVFQSPKELICQHQHRFQLESPAAVVEKIFKRGTKKVKHHDVVVSLDSVPSHIRNSQSPMQNPINFALIKELRMLGLDALELDRHLLAGGHVGPEVNVPEGTGADLAAEAIFLADAEFHG